MLEAGALLQGRYRIISQIGKGGMGTVYVARDENLGITIAVKQNFFEDDRLIEAFKREARLLASLRHTALPQVKDYFVDDTGQYLVMEYIAGDDLGTILDKRRHKMAPIGEVKPFEVDDVMRWAEQLLDALDYLHTRAESVVHRDIKPQNLKLAERSQIILLDFGLAKGNPLWMTRVTSSGSLYGYTPNYAPIEQIRGVGTDPRSDLYALGATLYHMVTGSPPLDAATRADALLGGEPDPLRPANELNPHVPNGLSIMLKKAMEPHRNNRYPSASEMLKALRGAKHSTVLLEMPKSEHYKPQGESSRIGETTSLSASLPPVDMEAHRRSQQEQERKAREEQVEAERRTKEEAERKQHEEQERRAREAELLSIQKDKEQKEREEAERLWQQRQQEKEREEREATERLKRIEEDAERRRQIAEREKEDSQRLYQQEKPQPYPLAEQLQNQQERQKLERKTLIAIIGGVVIALAIVLAVIISSKRENPSSGSPSTNSSAGSQKQPPSVLKPGVYFTSGKVYKVSLSDDGQVLASASAEAAIRLWQASGASELTGPTQKSQSVAVSHNGQIIASGSEDGLIRLWQTTDRRLTKTLRGHSDYVFSLGFSPDGQTLYSASGDKTIKLWSVNDGTLLRTVNTPEKGYLIVAVSPDLSLAGFYREDGLFKLWSLGQDSFLRHLEGNVPSINCGAFSNDGQMLALGSLDGDVQLWRTSDGRMAKALEKIDGKVVSLDFSGDGQILAAGLDNGAIKLWRVSDGQLIKTLKGHTESVNSLSFSADGHLLTSGSDDKSVRVWNVAEN